MFYIILLLCTFSSLLQQLGKKKSFLLHLIGFATSGQKGNTLHSSLLLPPIHIQGLTDC
jgi:hypothetical protein